MQTKGKAESWWYVCRLTWQTQRHVMAQRNPLWM